MSTIKTGGLLWVLMLGTAVAPSAERKADAGQAQALTAAQRDVAPSPAFVGSDTLPGGRAGRGSDRQTAIVPSTRQVAPNEPATRSPSNDNCANAVTFDLLAGQPVMFCDDNTGATEDCPALSGGAYREVWYKFTTYETTNVVIKYCGTTPAFYNAYIVLDTTCPCSGAWIFASNWESTSCGDGNWTLNWTTLSAGTYYWPLLTDSAYGYCEGPYCVTFTGGPPPCCPPVCPSGTMYGQGPYSAGDPWGAYTSAVTTQFTYRCFDNFSVTDQIGDIHWWGLSLFFNPYYGWQLCDPTGMTFDVGFYADNGSGQPGTEACAYHGLAPTIQDAGPFSWAELYYISVNSLQPCCALLDGWVSVQSQLNAPDCAFLWLNSPSGDFSSWQDQGGSLVQLGTNLAFCLGGGRCTAIPGACCDDYTGVCTDFVLWVDCQLPLRFAEGTLCANLTPTCGIRGACCDAGLNCVGTMLGAECDAVGGRFFPGQTCPEFTCPANCTHRIDLYDCYGDGWNGNTLDVLVNGVTVLSQITLPSGLGPLSFNFQAATGDTIQTIYYPTGGWPYEPWYQIYDGLGLWLGWDGTDGSNCYIQPTGITVTGNCNPPTTGACCYYAGGCDMVPEAECDPAIGLFLGLGHQCVECPCFVPCPPEGVPEQEPCGQDTNGGCNAAGWPFEAISCGETICGTMWANTSLRDTDWYQLTLTDGQYLTWTAESQVPLLLYIIQGAGPNDCSYYTILASATAIECEPATIGPLEGAPGGTYWFWAGPSAWENWPCNKHYTATLTCSPVPTGACCLPNGTCVETTPSGCVTQNGEYQGDYVPCTDPAVNCTPFYCGAGTSQCDEYISRVQIGTIDNPSGCETGYSNYTYLSADLPLGIATPLVVTNGNPIWTADTCSVWIDWNLDYMFDDFPPEALGDVVGVGPYNFDVTPPLGAVFGPTRMRIRVDYANPNPNPCGVTMYGEVEDYTVNILEVLGACCWPDGSCTSEPPSACGGYWGGPFTQCAGQDCNANGADDLCDILSGYSADCDDNGVPDECQPADDCNGNGIQDFCDIANGTSWDCNLNGIPDECELPPPYGNCEGPDCGQDCQPDGILDECQLEGGGGLWLMIDDGTSENVWGLTAGGEMCWINHFVTDYPGRVSSIGVAFGSPAWPGTSGVTPGQAVRVYVWSDPNQDGSPSDAELLGEGAGSVELYSIDTDAVQMVALPGSGIAVSGSFFLGASVVTTSGYPAPADDDGWTGPPDQGFLTFNSIPFDPNNITSNLYPMSSLGYPTTVLVLRVGGGAGCNNDCNGNEAPDECDVPPICQGPDCSQDCNSDLVPDECQMGCYDCNVNGRPDDCDLAEGSSLDCNGNGIPDECDIDPTDPDCNYDVSPDCHADGIPDECQLAGNDCNHNDIPDDCDIASGISCDCQGDGIPDECQLNGKSGGDYPMQWDDGSTENSLGLTAGGELCWIHHFMRPAGEPEAFVSSILTSFGTPSYPGSSGVSPGQPVRIYVWRDPNGDGNPSDAVFLGQGTGTVQASAIDTDQPQSIPIEVGHEVGESFFVGASVVTTSGYPAPMDQNGPQYNQAWIVFNTVPFDPVNLGASLYNMTDIGYPCNFLLRTVVRGCFLPCGVNDCNNNGRPDECDIGVEWGGHCAEQGPPCFPAECDSDWNHNGVPDHCWAELCGDFDSDGNVDVDDYWIFADAFGTCLGDPKYNVAADMDRDGCVTLLDYRAWRMCYLMANGKEFEIPRPKPLPKPGLAK